MMSFVSPQVSQKNPINFETHHAFQGADGKSEFNDELREENELVSDLEDVPYVWSRFF